MPNTYKKYCPHVFLAACDEEHEKGSEIIVETKRGNEHKCIVFNLVGKTRDGKFCYSVVRADGFNVQERAKRKAEKHQQYAENAEKRGDKHYEASQEGKDFLSLAEPIKIGHHSEKKHRALIDRNHARFGKSVEESKKADAHREKASYWESKADTINLSMPESLEYYEHKLSEAVEYHALLKKNKDLREHAYSLTYANKAVKDLKKKVETAQKLWG